MLDAAYAAQVGDFRRSKGDRWIVRKESIQMRKTWSRREFVHWMGYSSLASTGVCSSLLPGKMTAQRNGFAYVGLMGGEEDAIHVYAIRGSRWERVQAVRSERPVALAVSPNQRFLYAVNEIGQHRGLPSGTVEAFAIERDGRLAQLNRRELALSATMPRHAAVSPDGRSLVVAVRGGGAYNLLSIEEDGRLGRVSGILKEVGVHREGEGRTARPEMVTFDGMGRVVSVDGSAERLNILSLREGGLSAHARAELDRASGPSQVAIHPSGDRLYIMHAEAISCHPYDGKAGKVLEEAYRLPVDGVLEGSNRMAVHPSGDSLYASHKDGGVAMWSSRTAGRTMRAAGTQAREMGVLSAIEIAPDGGSLVALNRTRGQVLGAELDPVDGRPHSSAVLAQADSPASIVVLYT